MIKISPTQHKMLKAIAQATYLHSRLLIEPKKHRTVQALARLGLVNVVLPTHTSHMSAVLSSAGKVRVELDPTLQRKKA